MNDFLVPLIALSLMLAACGGGNLFGSDALPGVDIPLTEMKEAIRLSAPPEANTFQWGKDVRLIMESRTDTPVLFPEDCGARIFVRSKNQWTPILNDMGYPSGENLVIPSEQNPLRGEPVIVHPAIVDPSIETGESIGVRIVVIGTVQRDEEGADESVGAYIDVTLRR
jgi:hypothetical protein